MAKLFTYSATVVKVGNGIGFMFPKVDTIPFKENDKLTVTVTDDGKFIIENRYKNDNLTRTFGKGRTRMTYDRERFKT